MKIKNPKINSLKFEIALWQKVKLVKSRDGTAKFLNAQLTDDEFPSIYVSGYNRLNKRTEKFRIYCYVVQDDIGYSEMRKSINDYLYTPDDIMDAIRTRIINADTELIRLQLQELV